MLSRAWNWLKDKTLLVCIFIGMIGGVAVMAFFRFMRFIGGGSDKATGPYRDPKVLKAEKKKILAGINKRRKEREDARRKALKNNPFR
jgi:hypothetical protein